MSIEENSYETLDLGHWDNPTPGYDNPTPGYDNPTPCYDNATPGYDNPTPGYDNPTPCYDNATPGYDNPTPCYDNATPGYDNPTPGYDNPTPCYDNATSRYDNATPGYDNATPGYDNPTPCYDNATSRYDNATPGYDNATSRYDNATPGYDNPTPGYNNPTPCYDNATSRYDNPTPCYDNATPGYDNATSRYDQALPEMDTTQRTSYPPPPEYAEVLPDLQPGGMVNPPPYHINNASEGTFSKPTVTPSPGWTHPQDVRLPFPQPNDSHQIIQKPPPMYNPGYLTPQISEPTVFPPPMAFPSPQSAMYPGMMPPQQYPQNFPVPGTMMGKTVQPTVVTTQTTVISTPTPPCRDYLPWSIFNLLCCCCCFGIVALVFSLQTRSAKKYQDWESVQRKSRVALGFNLAAMLLGIALIIIIVPTVYYSLYLSSHYYSFPSYYNG